MDAKLDTTSVFIDLGLKVDEKCTVSTNFRLDGRKNGRDQDFRTFPENLKGVLKMKILEIRGTR